MNVDIMNVCVCVSLIMGDITVMRYQDVWTLIAPHLCLTSPVIEECVRMCRSLCVMSEVCDQTAQTTGLFSGVFNDRRCEGLNVRTTHSHTHAYSRAITADW